MKRIFSIAMLMALSTLGVRAQSIISGGELISPANMSHMEAAKFSQTEHSFMSARVSAMGGAFTSLGADLSSMAINPAGLGMYRSSEMGLSLGYDHTKATRSTGNLGSATSGNVSFNQIGAALNLYQSSGPLVSFTIGFGYNKLADLTYQTHNKWDGNVTIGEFFAEQMYGFDPAALNGSADPFRNQNIYPDEWGGVLAYQTYFINPNVDASGAFLDNYYVAVPLEAQNIRSIMTANSYGSVGEYDFSMGFNIGNFLYLGTTLGIIDIEQQIDYHLIEQYWYSTDAPATSNDAVGIDYMPSVANYGSGVNFKVGAIIRPVSAVRLGIAYHTSTLVSLTRDFYTEMATGFNDASYFANSLINSYTYDYFSPNKLLLGASVSILDKAIISVDYDRIWYGGMEMSNRELQHAFAEDVAADLGTSENFRIGLEVHPINGFYLRGGYAYYGTPFNAETQKYIEDGGVFFGSFKTHTSNLSLGAGLRFKNNSSLDVVWTNSKAHFTNSTPYYFNYVDDVDNILVTGPTMTDTKHTTNNVALTYSFRF